MTTYQSIVDQTAKSLDVIARLTNELKEMMKTTLEKTKDALRRLDGPSVAQVKPVNEATLELYTVTSSYLSLIVEAATQTHFIEPQVVAEAERFITSIAVCVKHFCRELNANAAVIAINVTEEGETQFDLTRKILIVMKEACEAKCQVARAALEQRNMLLFHGAMSLRTTGVKAADVDSESPTPEHPITSTVTPTNAASASTSTSISTSTQMLTTPINLQTQVHPPRPADKTLGSKSGKSSASQLQVSRFKSAEDPELWRLVSDVVVGKLNAQDALFPFSGQDAQHVLDAMQQIVTTSSTRPKSAADTPTARRSLRNLLLKLSLKYHRLPRVLFLQDVQCQSDSSSAGAFADIHRGTHQGAPVGLKRLRIFRNTAVDQKHMSEVINAFHHECLIWRVLSHEHVLPVLGVDDQMFKGELCMVMPWMKHGNIRNVIDDMRKRDEIDALLSCIHGWMKEIALGLSYLHGEGIAHGDLRGHNILIDENMHVRISDFGLAVFADSTSRSFGSTRGGNVRWLAPEIMDPNQSDKKSSRPTFAGDMYSFACVCVELYDPNVLFGRLSDFAVLGLVLDGNCPNRPWLYTTYEMGDPLWSIISQCWTADPMKRLTASEVLQRFEEDGVWAPSPEIFPDVMLDLGPDPPKYFETRRRVLLERPLHVEGAVEVETSEGAQRQTKPLDAPPRAGAAAHEDHASAGYVVLVVIVAFAISVSYLFG